ncbi:phospholipase/Carboxylesterase domain-containing protein [Sarocladium implicatum]|nr:phospholipase/Carboxylesterase domain-containing protein [Sarocladium implicatum]
MDDAPHTAFGAIHVLEPTTAHTHTAILLHGRGSTGQEFADDLAESPMSDGKPLMQAFPGWRWVFSSSPEIWSTVFEESMPAWFEAHSLTDITARQDLQIQGIRDSVKYIKDIVASEIARLGGSGDRVVLGGISQGGAIAIWTLLSIISKSTTPKPGAFVGASTWVPFAADIEKLLSGSLESQSSEGIEFVQSMIPSLTKTPTPIPVFLGHGIDDAYVDISLGRQARQVLSQAGLVVDWKEYSGADQEGHWLKAPEEVDDIARFLHRVAEPSL